VGRGVLEAIDAAISLDRGPPGFVGRVAIGLRDHQGELWLTATMNGRASSSLGARPLEMPDAAILLGEEEFRALVETGEAPPNPGLLQIWGDGPLLSKFLERYLIPKSAVSLRAEQRQRRRP
jgi:hypothetical protein